MRFHGRSATAVVLVVSLPLSGCVGFVTRHYEKVPRRERKQSTVVAPVIVVSLTASTEVEQDKLASAYEEVKEKHEFLSRARVEADASSPEEPADFTLEIHTNVKEKEWGIPELTGATFGLLPCYASERIEFRATLKGRDGVELATHTGTNTFRMVVQFWLVYAAPLNLLMVPQAHPRKKVLGGLLRLVERDIRHALEEQETAALGARAWRG